MQQLPRGYAGQKRNYLWAKVDLGNSQTLTVIATHLHHTEDAAGQALRLEQLPVLLDGWNGAARTVIVGDYNATPDSPEYAQLIAAGLRDAFLVAGGKPGDELTFTSDDPRRRIDYIWLSPDLRAVDFKATTLLGSDHRGIAVTVE